MSGLEGTKATDRLVANFALQIESYGLNITTTARPSTQPSYRRIGARTTWRGFEERAVALTVIEWNRKIERGLYLCNEGGAALEEIDAGIQAPGFNFTAYVKWDGFSEQASELPTSEMQSGPAKQVPDASREALRQHFRTRLTKRRQRTVSDWQSEGVPRVRERSHVGGAVRSAAHHRVLC